MNPSFFIQHIKNFREDHDHSIFSYFAFIHFFWDTPGRHTTLTQTGQHIFCGSSFGFKRKQHFKSLVRKCRVFTLLWKSNVALALNNGNLSYVYLDTRYQKCLCKFENIYKWIFLAMFHENPTLRGGVDSIFKFSDSLPLKICSTTGEGRFSWNFARRINCQMSSNSHKRFLYNKQPK